MTFINKRIFLFGIASSISFLVVGVAAEMKKGLPAGVDPEAVARCQALLEESLLLFQPIAEEAARCQPEVCAFVYAGEVERGSIQGFPAAFNPRLAMLMWALQQGTCGVQ